MFFEIKRVLGFSHEEWRNLSWVDSRMYQEQLTIYFWEDAHKKWSEQPAGKRGPEPKRPQFGNPRIKHEIKQSQQLDDIESIGGMDIT